MEGCTGKFIATLRGHVGAGSVYRFAWSAEGRMLISASKESTLKVWYPSNDDDFCLNFF